MKSPYHRPFARILQVLFAVAVFALMLVPARSFAQEAAPDPVSPPAVAQVTDGAIALPASTAGTVSMLTPFIALAVTALARYTAKLPGWALPILAAVAGGGVDYILHLFTNAQLNPILGVTLGLAATGLHQLKAQITKPKSPEAVGSSVG